MSYGNPGTPAALHGRRFKIAVAACLGLGLTVGTMPLGAQQLSEAELDELLAPIALYPDPLLAQILPASTFVDQIDEAARVLQGRSDPTLIDGQSWDVSVKSVAHYPDVLNDLAQHRDWTVALGQAYVASSEAVMQSVQRLRTQATAAGTLETNEYQTVTESTTVIEIEPAEPEVIYVPTYDPDLAYGYDPAAAWAGSIVGFGVGLAMGAWLNNDIDWVGGSVFYHGWNGDGWVGASRGNINMDNVYVDNRFQNVNVNRDIANRDNSAFRERLARDGQARGARERGAARPQPVDGQRRLNGGATDHRTEALRNRDVGGQQLQDFRGRTSTMERPARRPERTAPQYRAPDRRLPGAQPAPRGPRATQQRSGSAFRGMSSGHTTRVHSARGAGSMGSARAGGFRGGRGGGGRRR